MTIPNRGITAIGRPDDAPPLSLKEAAKFLGVSTTQILRLIKGKFDGPVLRHARAGKRILIKRAWIDAWLEESARQR
jgi:excisionase family DNA binding protein